MKETQEKWKRKKSQDIRGKEMRKEENSQNNRKEQGITLIALVVTIVVLLILAGITINMLFSNGGIFKTAQDAANAWNEATINEQESLSNIAEQIGNLVNGQVGGGSGTEPEEPEKIPADGSFSKEKGVNTPDLQDGALTPVKWVEEPKDSGTYTMQETTAEDPEWYDYSTTAKKWANAITEDGSVWVWVPRYAYQISSNYHTNSISGGTINIKFMKGTTNEAADGTSTWSNSSGQGNWNIHPGFNYSSTASGLWVAKFEASQSDAGANAADYQNSTGGTSGIIKIQPGVNSWRNITIDTMYTKCLNYDTETLQNANLNSHLMKNTEWGAVAYLAQSSYGKNAEVWINPNSNFLTGQAGTGASVGSTTSTSAYNSGNGPQASTTGNVYGVYDMSGGAYEYTAAYVNNGNEELTSNGASLVSGAVYTKDVYTKGSVDDRPTNYVTAASKYGDAVYETSLSSNGTPNWNTSWYSDCSNFPYSTVPFFIRGGSHVNTSSAGLFSFYYHTGDVYSVYGFRPVLVAL